jgi:hypothetical protein
MQEKEEEARALIDTIYKEKYADNIFEKKKKEAMLLLQKMSFHE